MRVGLLVLATAMAVSLLPASERAWADDAPAILQPLDGAKLSNPVTIIVSPGEATTGSAGAMTGMGGHGMNMAAGGHLHLLVDSTLPKPGARIPMDARHIHLMHGETRVKLRLAPGQHTLQLVKGTRDHRVPADPETSPIVTITVR